MRDPNLAANLNLTDVNGLNMTSTISEPNMKKLITAIALILLDQIEEDASSLGRPSAPEWDVFNEEHYLRDKRSQLPEAVLERLSKKPTADHIESFMTAIFEFAEFSPECNVLSLLYINRLIAFTGLPLHSGNWRPLIFISLIVAQKVWDDKYLGNKDFSLIYPFFTAEEINAMERSFLSLLQYNVTVRPSTYAKYYFELRSFFKTNPDDLNTALPPLDPAGADRLARCSTNASEAVKGRFTGTNDFRSQTIH